MNLVDQEHLRVLSPMLTVILKTELAKGNEVVEVCKHYPERDSIFVALEHAFAKAYPQSHSIEFREVNDPHYWKAHYEDIQLEHLLVCGF